MPSPKTAAVKAAQLNRMTRAASDAALGDVIADLIANQNALLADVTMLRTKLAATQAKLDADGGVTDTNYVALQGPTAITAVVVADLASR